MRHHKNKWVLSVIWMQKYCYAVKHWKVKRSSTDTQIMTFVFNHPLFPVLQQQDTSLSEKSERDFPISKWEKYFVVPTGSTNETK